MLLKTIHRFSASQLPFLSQKQLTAKFFQMTKFNFLVIAILAYFPLFAQNYSLQFDGTDDEIRVTDTTMLSMDNQMSLEVWLKIDASAAGGKNMIINREGEYQVGVAGNGRVSWAFANTQPGWAWRATNAYVNVDVWTQLTLTYDTGEVKVYIDGILEDTYQGNGGIGDVSTANNDFTIGWRTANFDNRYTGYMDELRVWNIALDTVHINDFWNEELTGTESGLMLYYKMDDTTAVCDVTDCSSNLINGTRNGTGGTNNLPIYTDSIPTITDVACGKSSCFSVSDHDIEIKPIKAWSSVGQLFIEDKEGLAKHIHIFNTLGQRVFSRTDIPSQNTFSIQHLPTGVYFVQLLGTNREHLLTQKIWHQ